MIANDLNPSSYNYLLQNAKRNKVSRKLYPLNLDARDFLNAFLTQHDRPDLINLPNKFTHIYMNLPMDALEFLDVLKGKFDRNIWETLPKVHVYGFAKQLDCEELLIERIKRVWGEFDADIIKFTQVRDISPKKFMFCLEFTIPASIAYNEDLNFDNEIIRKRMKIVEEGENK